jgi:bisphosphoglycerate-dependent phosphoglycerate mutase
MKNKIKKQIDGLASNINELYFNSTIMSLTTVEEFEYFFSILTTMVGYNSTLPANVTWFYNFFDQAPKISYPIVLKYVVNKKLYSGWATLLLRNTENWSDEIFDLWSRSYDYINLLREIKNEKILNILNEDQLRKLVYYFQKNSGEMFISA